MADVQAERRKYKRLNAPVFCRPLGRHLSASQEIEPFDVQDVSLGGIRVYSDDRHAEGDRLELELYLPSGEGVVLETTVVWVETLPGADPARFEIGLKFVDVAQKDLEKLAGLLKDT